MRVNSPVTPRTRAPNTQLGYEQPARVTGFEDIGHSFARAVNEFTRVEDEKRKKQEEFDIKKRILDEANFRQTDYNDRVQNADPGAPNFVQALGEDYLQRNNDIVQEFKDRGASQEGLDELQLRLGEVNNHYLGQAIAFKEKSELDKADLDIGHLGDSATQYAYNNPTGAQSAIDEMVAAIRAMPIPVEAQDKGIEREKQKILNSLAVGYGRQYAEEVVGRLAPEDLKKPQPTTVQIASAPSGTYQSVATNIANEFGLPAEQVAGVFSYETAGTFDPNKMGGKGGRHMGLIQFGPEERKKYGIDKNASPEQWTKAISSYLHDRGFKKGMSLLDFYSTINAGKPGRYNASDGNGTVKSHVGKILNEHVANASNWLQQGGSTQVSFTPNDAYPNYPVVPNPDRSQWGDREDGTSKGDGWLGVRQRPDGSVSSEISVGVEIDGKETEIPLMVPGLTPDEMKYLMETPIDSPHFLSDMPKSILDKAKTHAKQQMDAGKSPFVEQPRPAEAGKTGDPNLDKLSGPQLELALGAARSELSRRETAQRQADAEQKAAEREAYNTKFNDFLNGLQDGTLNQVDINTAYGNGQGWLTDYEDRMKAQNIINARQKKDEDLARFSFMWKSGVKFNPYDPDAQKAADAGFDAAIKDLQKTGHMDETSSVVVAGRMWEKTGILPKQGAIALRGGLVSVNPAEVAGAASVASNMLARDPNAFAGVEGGDEITKTAATYAHYVDDLGMTAQEAANKVSTMNTPEYQAKLKADQPAREKFAKDIRAMNITKVVNQAVVGSGGFFSDLVNPPSTGYGDFTEPQKAEAQQTFLDLALDAYDKNHDTGAALAYARQRMSALYGIEGGQLMKFPPSKAYPEVNGSRAYILDQAKTFVDAYAGFPVPREQVFLVPTGSGSTANSYRAGQPVPYEVHFFTIKDGQAIYHVIPGKVFTADVGQAQREAAVKARTYEQTVRTAKENQIELAPERFNLGGF